MEVLIGLVALLVAFFNSFRQAYVKKLTDSTGTLTLTYLIMLYATLLVLPFFFFSFQQSGGAISISAIVFGLLSGVLGVGKTLSSVKALKEADLSIADPFLKLAPLIVLFGELALLQVNLTLVAVLGVFTTVFGSFAVVIDEDNIFSVSSLVKTPGIKYAVAATFFAAASTLSIKTASLGINSYMLTGLWYVSGLFSIALYLGYKKKFPSLEGHLDKRYPFVGFYSAILGIVSIYLYSVASATVISAIYQFSVLPSVLIGGKFFLEEDMLKRGIGATLILVGTSALIFL